MVTDKLYYVDLLAELWDCWSNCDIYSANLIVYGGTNILHNFLQGVVFLTSISL